jgi:putative glutamine amidotransferase
MTGPVIGISAALERVNWGAWEAEANLSPRPYSEAVAGAGAVPIILPVVDAVATDPDRFLELVDGLLLSGGSDIDPASYGAAPGAEISGARPERDRVELSLAWRALELDLPLLGICRGMELLNVATGGTLVQHLPDRVGHDGHRHTPGAFSDHEVRLEPGSLAAEVVGAERTDVKSHHHQGLDELGEEVVASGWSDDGVVEAIELPERRFALGVLWHPEEDERSRVIGALVEASERRAARAA